MELYEDGFATKEKQVIVLENQGLSKEQIAEKTGYSLEKVNEIINSKVNMDKNNLNE